MPAIADLSSADLDAIREATEAAEAGTGGELVCVLVKRCDAYESMPWKGAALGTLAGVAAATLWDTLAGGWSGWSPYYYPLLTLLGAVIGFCGVALLPRVRRLLVPAEVLDRRVDRRAAAAWLEEEIDATRDRSGILIFVAFFEHRVRILADRGIEERVDPGVWEGIAGELTRGLRAGRTREALLQAVEACGSVLSEAMPPRPDDENELRDEPRLVDE